MNVFKVIRTGANCAEPRGLKKELELDPESVNNLVKRTPGAPLGFIPAQARKQKSRPSPVALNRAPVQGRGEWANQSDPKL